MWGATILRVRGAFLYKKSPNPQNGNRVINRRFLLGVSTEAPKADDRNEEEQATQQVFLAGPALNVLAEKAVERAHHVGVSFEKRLVKRSYARSI